MLTGDKGFPCIDNQVSLAHHTTGCTNKYKHCTYYLTVCPKYTSFCSYRMNQEFWKLIANHLSDYVPEIFRPLLYHRSFLNYIELIGRVYIFIFTGCHQIHSNITRFFSFNIFVFTPNKNIFETRQKNRLKRLFQMYDFWRIFTIFETPGDICILFPN